MEREKLLEAIMFIATLRSLQTPFKSVTFGGRTKRTAMVGLKAAGPFWNIRPPKHRHTGFHSRYRPVP